MCKQLIEMMIMTQRDHGRLSRAARKHRLQTWPGLAGSPDEARGGDGSGGSGDVGEGASLLLIPEICFWN